MNAIAQASQFADKTPRTWGRIHMLEEQEVASRSVIQRWFPERHVYLRSNGDTRGYILTSGRQMGLAGVAAAAAAWTLIASGGFIFDMIARGTADAKVVEARAASERLNADLQARLETAVVRMSATTGGLDEMARMVERRHAALTGVMGMFQGVEGAQAALAPTVPLRAADTGPIQRIVAVRMDQERLIERAGDVAQSRAERLRLAFRLAGLNPAAYGAASNSALGGPLIEASDPKALATILDVDEPFAIRIRHAADNLSEMRNLTDAARSIPFERPTQARTTSGFGVRFDPFNGRPAVHQGQDFAAPLNTPIHATAPGVVAFAGVRSGYGNTIEIDHGRGFKTRFAHLNTVAVEAGQRIALGQRIGAMGTTGRSTGVHLHYEVWMDGRPQNPARFFRAGDQIVQ